MVLLAPASLASPGAHGLVNIEPNSSCQIKIVPYAGMSCPRLGTVCPRWAALSVTAQLHSCGLSSSQGGYES